MCPNLSFCYCVLQQIIISHCRKTQWGNFMLRVLVLQAHFNIFSHITTDFVTHHIHYKVFRKRSTSINRTNQCSHEHQTFILRKNEPHLCLWGIMCVHRESELVCGVIGYVWEVTVVYVMYVYDYTHFLYIIYIFVCFLFFSVMSVWVSVTHTFTWLLRKSLLIAGLFTFKTLNFC